MNDQPEIQKPARKRRTATPKRHRSIRASSAILDGFDSTAAHLGLSFTAAVEMSMLDFTIKHNSPEGK